MAAGAEESLGERLRQLRESLHLTQTALAQALGRTSVDGKKPSDSSVSLWERNEAQPGDRWLDAYARLFSVRTVDEPGDRRTEPRLSEADLKSQLKALRERSTEGPAEGNVVARRSQRGFWRFQDGQPITVVGTPMYSRWVERIAYADPYHPNYIESIRNADMDATVNLVVHLTRVNPDSSIEFLTHDRLQARHFTGHLVVLGGADTSFSSAETEDTPTEQRTRSELGRYLQELRLPMFTRLPADGDDEYDTEFVVTTDADKRPTSDGIREEIYAPAFVRYRIGDRGEQEFVHSYPQLEHDVGLLVRQLNPSNSATTLTICSGVFSRGSFGAVAATTDESLADRNENFIRETFGSADRADPLRFWMLFKVPIRRTSEGAMTLPPDLSRTMLRGASLS
jgi:transcriptional regulator with XRE-family HTH domain